MERIRDLLADGNDNLQIHENRERGVYVRHATEVYAQVDKIIRMTNWGYVMFDFHLPSYKTPSFTLAMIISLLRKYSI